MTGGVECGCVPGHRMMVVTSICDGCGLTERDIFEDPALAERPCIRGLWPPGVRVPERMVAGIAAAPEGHEEGDLCGRTYPGTPFCLGKLVHRPRAEFGGCYCGATWAPCSSCMSTVPECPACGHREPEPD